MNLEKIRTTIIIAICSDDYLFNRLVLKDGNALKLLHGVGLRTSVDIDFSIEDDFDDLEFVGTLFKLTLEKNFSLLGLSLFDYKFYPKPKATENDWWGGYCVDFKLIAKPKSDVLSNNLEQMRREALSIDSNRQSSRKFTIDISKNAYVANKEQSEIDGYVCYVYTPSMIAAEKLRAICQQMPEYEYVKAKKRRSRDFYDLYSLIEEAKVDFSNSEFQNILIKIFDSKKVPLSLLPKIGLENVRFFHETDWPSTRDTIEDRGKSFEYYYAYVCEKISMLEPLWVK